MTDLTPKGKHALVITGIAIVVLIVAGVLFWRASERTSSPPVPEPGRTETPPEFEGSLPYSGDGFSVDYIEADGSYIVNIYEEPVEDKKQLALHFLRTQGVNTDLAPINYFYGSDVSEHSGP